MQPKENQNPEEPNLPNDNNVTNSQISQAPIVNPSQQSSFVSHTQSTTQPTTKKLKTLIVVLVLIIILLIGVAGWLALKSKHQATKAMQKPSNSQTVIHKTQTPTSDICYIQSSNINCVNDNGGALVQRTLPTIAGETIEQLAPNANDTQYVAFTNNRHLFILSDKLSEISELILPSGLQTTASAIPAWSHDGKSLFMELDTSDNSSSNWRQIYRYDIGTKKYTQLTSSNLNSTPFQTQDGHIVYLYMNGDIHTNTAGWAPHIMNADGSNAKPFTADVNSSGYSAAYTKNSSPNLDLNYDSRTDTVFVDASASPLIYETVNDLMAGKTPASININSISGTVAPGALARISESKLLFISSPGYKMPLVGQFIDLNSGNILESINNFGSDIVGVLPNADAL